MWVNNLYAVKDALGLQVDYKLGVNLSEVTMVYNRLGRVQVSSSGFEFAWQSQSFDSYRNMDLDVNRFCFNALSKCHYI